MLRPILLPLVRMALALALAGAGLAACSDSTPPTMDTVRKLVADDKDFDALQILLPMAQSGDAAAQYELAGFYHYGYVGPADFDKARKWYRASARQGYADAMVGLSVMYLGGQGVGQDRREAYVWLNLAAQYMTDRHALAKVKGIRDEIGKGLTKDDVAFAKAETMLLLPESASVQPNEAESIDHLPDQLPPETAPVVSEPLQNIPPDTAPLTDIPLQNAPPAAPLIQPASKLPSTTATMPESPALPATTAPATPILPEKTPGTPAASPSSGGTSATPTVPLAPVPEF